MVGAPASSGLVCSTSCYRLVEPVSDRMELVSGPVCSPGFACSAVSLGAPEPLSGVCRSSHPAP